VAPFSAPFSPFSPQRDLSVSYERLGDLLSALGQGEEARRYYQQALEIRARLAAAEPERADYQRDLVISLARVADSDDGAKRRELLLQARDILAKAQREQRWIEDAHRMMQWLAGLLDEQPPPQGDE